MGMAAQASGDTGNHSYGACRCGRTALPGGAAANTSGFIAIDVCDGARAPAFPCATTDFLAAVLFAEGATHPATPACTCAHTHAHAAAGPHSPLSTDDTNTCPLSCSHTGSAAGACCCTSHSTCRHCDRHRCDRGWRLERSCRRRCRCDLTPTPYSQRGK